MHVIEIDKTVLFLGEVQKYSAHKNHFYSYTEVYTGDTGLMQDVKGMNR